MAVPSHDYDASPTDIHAPSFRQELRVIGIVLAFVALLEILARVLAPSLDRDRKRIHDFPQTISNLEHRARISGHPRVVFFGNSLMLRGLDEDIVRDELLKHSRPAVETAKITPVGTAMLDWIYLYQRYFKTEDSQPDVLIAGFVGHNIHDQEPIKIRRLSRHFVAIRDFPALWRTDLEDFHQLVQSALCGVSALEGDQPEHELAILNCCVPDYQDGLNANHRLIEDAAARKTRSKTASGPADRAGAATETFTRMKRFIDLCQGDHVRIVFVAMPQPEFWNINPEAIRLAHKHDVKVLDARAIDGMTEADFIDGYHLGPTGAAKFSRWLAGALAETTGAFDATPDKP